MKTAVYCSASNRLQDEYLRIGDIVGERLAEMGDSLVYGGATGGLMTRVSESFRRHLPNDTDARLIGVVPVHIARSERKSMICDDLYLVENMSQRKQMMRTLADRYVCLPGSYGTLDEMMDVIASGTVGEHRKPLYILNYNGFYDSLKSLIGQMKTLDFIPESENYKPVFADSIDELFLLLTNN